MPLETADAFPPRGLQAPQQCYTSAKVEMSGGKTADIDMLCRHYVTVTPRVTYRPTIKESEEENVLLTYLTTCRPASQLKSRRHQRRR